MDNQEKEKAAALIKEITARTSTNQPASTHSTNKKNEFTHSSSEVNFFTCFICRIIIDFFLACKGQTQMMWWIVTEALLQVSQIGVKPQLHLGRN